MDLLHKLLSASFVIYILISSIRNALHILPCGIEQWTQNYSRRQTPHKTCRKLILGLPRPIEKYVCKSYVSHAAQGTALQVNTYPTLHTLPGQHDAGDTLG